MAKLFTDLVNRSLLVNVAIISQSGELHTQSFNESAVVRGSPVAFFNPAIPTKIFSQSRNPDSYTGQFRSRSYNFVEVHFLNLGGPFR